MTVEDNRFSEIFRNYDEEEVCSDYHFHSEENFKIKFWVEVITRNFFSASDVYQAISPNRLRQWWKKNVRRNASLSCLNSIFAEIINIGDAWGEKNIPDLIDSLWKEGQTNGNKNGKEQQRLIYKLMELAGNFISSLRGGVGDCSRKFKVEDDEFIIFKKPIQRLTHSLVDEIGVERSSSAPSLVASISGNFIGQAKLFTRKDLLLSIIQRMTVNKNQLNETANFGEKQRKTKDFDDEIIPYNNEDLCNLVSLTLKEKFLAVPFVIQKNIPAFKIFRENLKNDSQQQISVTDDEIAFISEKIALENLEIVEKEIKRKWKIADEKCRENLREGFKNVAGNFLKERKMLEKKLDEIHLFRLKISENSENVERIKIQQTILDTLASFNSSVSLKSNLDDLVDKGETLVIDTENVTDKISTVNGLLDTLQYSTLQISDSEVEQEFAKLVREQEDSLVLPPVPSRRDSQSYSNKVASETIEKY